VFSDLCEAPPIDISLDILQDIIIYKLYAERAERGFVAQVSFFVYFCNSRRTFATEFFQLFSSFFEPGRAELFDFFGA
jgi:hypothetical protein